MPSPVVETEVMDCYAALKLVATGAKVRRQMWPEGDCIFLHAEILHLRDSKGMHVLQLHLSDFEGTDWEVLREH